MFDIIYEDEHVLIANKPPNILVIPAPGKNGETLTDAINNSLAKKGLTVKAHPCHRLDYETSGAIIYAKGKKMQQMMMDKFHQNDVKKKYIAFVHGVLAKDNYEIKNPIEGKPAITRYRILDKRRNYTVVEVELVTGRTNQIRIHFKQVGYPLVGERKFAFAKDYHLKFRRVALHAAEVSFSHPVTGERMIFKAPLPEDMEQFLRHYS
jgi:23S rRNA pseudouridine1911/1915/1917 synthase